MASAIGNFARIFASNLEILRSLKRWLGLRCKIQLCGTITSVSREFAERAAHACDDIIQAFEHGTFRALFSRPRPQQPYAGSDSCALPNEIASR